MLAVVIAEGVAIALLGVLVLGLLRSHALILKALHELGAGLELESSSAATGSGGSGAAGSGGSVGPVAVELEAGVVPGTRPATTRARDLIGSGLDGSSRGVGVAEGRHLLAFLSSGCSVCQSFWDDFSRGVTDSPGGADLVVVAKGSEEESPTTLRKLAGESLPVLQSTAAWDAYGIPGSPYFVLVEDGVITGEGSATTWPQVRDLLGQAVEETTEARRAAGRTGPGSIGPSGGRDGGAGGGGGDAVADSDDAGGRDSLPRMDRELLVAGISPGHPSLYDDPDQPITPSPADRTGDLRDEPHRP